MINFILSKSSLTVEVWEHDTNGWYSEKDEIDIFTIALSSRLHKFNLSNSLTVEGHHRVGNLTLSYGNLTTDPTSCTSAVQPTLNTILCTPPGNLMSADNFSTHLNSCFFFRNSIIFTALIQTHHAIPLCYNKEYFLIASICFVIFSNLLLFAIVSCKYMLK